MTDEPGDDRLTQLMETIIKQNAEIMDVLDRMVPQDIAQTVLSIMELVNEIVRQHQRLTAAVKDCDNRLVVLENRTEQLRDR